MKLSEMLMVLLAAAMLTGAMIISFSPIIKAYATEDIVDADFEVLPETEVEPEAQYSEPLHMPDVEGLIPTVPHLIDADEREMIMEAVYAAAGDQGYHTMLLVAQSIRDGAKMADESPKDYIAETGISVQLIGRYSACKHDISDAVDVIFNMGYRVTEEQINCFYNPFVLGISAWYESQDFVTESGNLRFFCTES